MRLANNEIDYEQLDKDDLYLIGKLCAHARETLYRVTSRLNDLGDTFGQIATTLDVHEATASRWARPPAEDRRRRKGEPGE